MDIRDESLLERSFAWLRELLEFTQKRGRACNQSPHLAADVHRKASALNGSLSRLKQVFDKAEPPPPVSMSNQPLYLRIGRPEIRQIARLVGHHGCPEDELYALTKQLAGEHGAECVREAMLELTWLSDAAHRWIKLRPSVIRACRPWIGPLPDAEDYAFWWRDRGGPPPLRSPETEKAKKEEAKEESEPQTKPKKRKRVK